MKDKHQCDYYLLSLRSQGTSNCRLYCYCLIVALASVPNRQSVSILQKLMKNTLVVENQSAVGTLILNSSTVLSSGVLVHYQNVVSLKTKTATLEGWKFRLNSMNALVVSSKASLVGQFLCVNFTRLGQF